ncbi:PIG-L deacetylase family protein [Alphaproteobacteria bacterium LSUCC0396]
MINLVVVAHPDDEVLGLGGTGKLLVDAGEVVQSIVASGQVDARTHRPENDELLEDIASANSLLGFSFPVLGAFPNIMLNTVPHLELVQFVEKAIIDFQPDRIFTHHPNDLNDDHRHLSRACTAAARLFQRRNDIKPLNSLYYMEIPSSTDWALPEAQLPFLPNVFFDITSSIEQKISALKCYRNVMRPAPHPRSEEVIKGLASYRGGQSGFLYAEAFQLAFRRGF